MKRRIAMAGVLVGMLSGCNEQEVGLSFQVSVIDPYTYGHADAYYAQAVQKLNQVRPEGYALAYDNKNATAGLNVNGDDAATARPGRARPVRLRRSLEGRTHPDGCGLCRSGDPRRR